MSEEIPKSELWTTPNWLFNVLNDEFKFTCDLAASKTNAKCDVFFSKENSAFDEKNPPIGRSNFCNPPYVKILKWVERAYFLAMNHGQSTVLLLPSDTGTRWFKYSIVWAKEVRFITMGRVAFINTLTGKEKKINGKPSVLIHFDSRSRYQFSSERTVVDLGDMQVDYFNLLKIKEKI